MGDLDTVPSQDEQAVGAEDVDDRVDVRGRLRFRGAQIGPAAPAPRELTIWRNCGELGEYQACGVLPPTGESVVGGLGALIDRVGDSARMPVGTQGEHATLTAFPGGSHRLRHQRQHAAAQSALSPFAQLCEHRFDQGGLHG